MSTTPEILVGIPTYSGADSLLPWCLDGIRKRTGTSPPFDLAVVDDSGCPTHAARIERCCKHFDARFLVHEHNRGVAAGWNTLARSGDHKYVVLLNDDLIVSPGWLEALVYFLRENPRAGSAGLFAYFIIRDDVPQLLAHSTAQITPRDPFSKVLASEELGKHSGTENPGRVMAPPGCGFGFRRKLYDLVGGFDERYCSFYEEADFGTSCAAAGYPAYALQWPACYHIWSATFGQSPELRASQRMLDSRAAYIAKWGAHTEVTHPRFMSQIPFQHLRWLTPMGMREGVVDGEHGIREPSGGSP